MDGAPTAAELIVSDHFGSRVELTDPVVLREIDGRALIVRYRAGDETFIVKRSRSVAVADANPSMFFDEWASLQFLGTLNLDPPVAPVLFGGDRDALLIVIEDLGDGPSLVEPLLGDAEGAAIGSLEGFARCLGRLHASTAGQTSRFAELRRSFGPEGDHWLRLDSDLAAFTRSCRNIGVDVDGAAESEIRDALGRLQRPGPYLTLVHGDPCPDNVRTAGPTRLFDFDGSRYRHCLIDAVCLWVPFPSCWCANGLPRAVSTRLDAIYRAELAEAIPEAGDDDSYRPQLLDARVMWVVLFTSSGTVIGDVDREWGIATVRQRILAQWRGLLEEFALQGSFPALAALGERLIARLEEIWPDVKPLPLYPPFRPGTRVYIGLGSNVGDRLGNLRAAVRALDQQDSIEVVALSGVYETDPVGPEQPDFLNAVVEIETDHAADELLRVFKEIESQLGRIVRERWGPREIDLDLLVYGDAHIETDDLVVPHPQIATRAFVLVPLVEIAPVLDIPGVGPASGLLARLDRSGVRVFGDSALLRD